MVKQMDLSKTLERGKFKIHYNDINETLFRHWKDNKVVNFISILLLVSVVAQLINED